MQYVDYKSISTPAQGSLYSAIQQKKRLNAEIKLLRNKLKNAPIGGSGNNLRLKILQLQDLKYHAEQAEKQARAQIEKRANELGLTTLKTIKNPARKKSAAKKQRSPEKQYKDFHHKTGHKTITDTIDIPDKFIHIGKAVSLIYESDKFDGKPRLYKHDFKKHGNILAKPEGKTGYSDIILMNGLKFKIKKEGITG